MAGTILSGLKRSAVVITLTFAVSACAANQEISTLEEDTDVSTSQPEEPTLSTVPSVDINGGEAADAGDPTANSANRSAVRVEGIAQVAGVAAPDDNGEASAEGDKDTPVDSAQSPSAKAEPTPVSTEPNPDIPSGGNASDVEREIARLTNELRIDPSGPFRREGDVPTCDGNVTIDPATGQPTPVVALTFSDSVSVEMARPWSAQMSAANFEHRDGQQETLQSLGIDPRSWGENIAYTSSTSDVAQQHFEQWRQSDGHFCNMVNPGFTHIGVGQSNNSDGSFATQNFYTPA